MSYTRARLEAFKTNAGPYDAERVEESNEQAKARRTRAKNPPKRHKRKASPRRNARALQDHALWERAAYHLPNVFGEPRGRLEAAAAVTYAKALMRRGIGVRLAMHIACVEARLTRDEFSQAVLSMRGVK